MHPDITSAMEQHFSKINEESTVSKPFRAPCPVNNEARSPAGTSHRLQYQEEPERKRHIAPSHSFSSLEVTPPPYSASIGQWKPVLFRYKARKTSKTFQRTPQSPHRFRLLTALSRAGCTGQGRCQSCLVSKADRTGAVGVARPARLLTAASSH